MKAAAELAGGISEKDAEAGLLLIKSGLPAFSQSALLFGLGTFERPSKPLKRGPEG